MSLIVISVLELVNGKIFINKAKNTCHSQVCWILQIDAALAQLNLHARQPAKPARSRESTVTPVFALIDARINPKHLPPKIILLWGRRTTQREILRAVAITQRKQIRQNPLHNFPQTPIANPLQKYQWSIQLTISYQTVTLTEMPTIY